MGCIFCVDCFSVNHRMIPADFTLYASDDTDAAVSDARAYIKTNQLTADDVRLIKRDGMTLVVAKRELWK